MKSITTSTAPQAIGPYSQAVVYNDLVFCSGQIGMTPKGLLVSGLEAQTHQVIRNLGAVLESAGSSLAQVLKTTLYLTNIDDFALINGIYETYFGVTKPARATVAVAALPKGALIEIECVAMRP